MQNLLHGSFRILQECLFKDQLGISHFRYDRDIRKQSQTSVRHRLTYQLVDVTNISSLQKLKYVKLKPFCVSLLKIVKVKRTTY